MPAEFKGLKGGLAAGFVLACMLAAVCSCSSRAGSAGGGGGADSARAGEAAPRLTLTNFTGTTIRAIYVSPHDSAGWEENVLGRDELVDGDTVEIRFSPEEKAAAWDMRVESVDGYGAEWQSLNLREISGIKLRVSTAGETVVVAEAE